MRLPCVSALAIMAALSPPLARISHQAGSRRGQTTPWRRPDALRSWLAVTDDGGEAGPDGAELTLGYGDGDALACPGQPKGWALNTALDAAPNKAA